MVDFTVDQNGNLATNGSVDLTATAGNGVLLKDTANGHTYKLQMVNGTLTPTQVS